MAITINTGKIGSGPSVTWTISWDGSGNTVSVTGKKNADGALYNTNTSAGWTCYVGFESGSSVSKFFYSKDIGFSNGGASSTKSYTMSITNFTITKPESGTLYFYTTSSSFGSTGVISYANRKKATFYKVTAQDRALNPTANLGTSAWKRIQSGTSVSATSIKSAGSYTGYTYASSTSSTITSNTTLYNNFNRNNYTVTYYGNDANGTVANVPSSATVAYGTAISSTVPTDTYKVTFNANGGTCSTSYLNSTRSFSSWNTAANGSGTSYSAGAALATASNVSLYAQWGTATSINLPTATRTAYKFGGWDPSSTATTGITGSYTPPGNIILYAVWTPNGIIRIYDSTSGTFKQYAVWIYVGDGGGPNSNGWHHAMPMVYCNANGSTKFHTAG